MISIELLTSPDGHRPYLLGFRMEGHAGWGVEGTDIVCAAVSSAAYLTANTILEVLGVAPALLEVEDGSMLLCVEQRDEPRCRAILSGFKLHMQGLEEQYPDYIKVSYS